MTPAWFHDTVAVFGSQLGLRIPTPGHEGGLQLAFGSGELLSLEALTDRDPPQALVCMERAVGHPPDAAVRRALALGHVVHGSPFPVQVAVRPSQHDLRLVALARIPQRYFTADSLALAVERLHRWLDDALSPQRP